MEQAGIWPDPPGLQLHVLFGPEDNLHVSEIWSSREEFQAYGQSLMPILADIGIEFSAEPDVSKFGISSSSTATHLRERVLLRVCADFATPQSVSDPGKPTRIGIERRTRDNSVRCADRRAARISRAECHEPPKGGAGHPRAGDVRIITTVDEQTSNALLEEWPTAVRSRRHEAVCVRCGAPVDGEESDASLMLGVVLLLIANTLVIAALVAAVVWIVA